MRQVNLVFDLGWRSNTQVVSRLVLSCNVDRMGFEICLFLKKKVSECMLFISPTILKFMKLCNSTLMVDREC